MAGDNAKALAFAQRASEADPASEGAALLALDMLPATPAVDAQFGGGRAVSCPATP